MGKLFILWPFGWATVSKRERERERERERGGEDNMVMHKEEQKTI